MNRKGVKHISVMAMMISIALILSYVETLIPAIPIPGAKIGLPNIISLLALSVFGLADALIILVIRATISSLLFSSVVSLAYSLAGGILSLLAMYIVLKVLGDRVSLTAVSMLGAVTHSIGQVLIAVIIVETLNIITILPILVIISIVTGLVVGLCVKHTLKYFKMATKVKGAQ